ncbi:DUF6199 family natural product biosynthesis protein [Paenibacillus beijingensis]|uniref:DUF6199 domain-containing protein n=1 Tax=Paenibacillus beijingensis TaxID=1126833 RepID=A0A0D5NFF9_9BACL|nr:hypothetical protein VN24_04480 [Paenibacillus beijingensis]
MTFIAIFLLLAGFLMVFKTSLFWSITERWTSKDGTEPSDLYVWNTRFGGIMCMIVGIAGIVIDIVT